MFPILNPPPSSLPYHPSESQCTSPKHPVSCIEPGLVTRFIYNIIHISMPFSQIIPPSPSPITVTHLFCNWKFVCLFKIIFLLKYGWFTLLCSFLLYRKKKGRKNTDSIKKKKKKERKKEKKRKKKKSEGTLFLLIFLTYVPPPTTLLPSGNQLFCASITWFLFHYFCSLFF